MNFLSEHSVSLLVMFRVKNNSHIVFLVEKCDSDSTYLEMKQSHRINYKDFNYYDFICQTDEYLFCILLLILLDITKSLIVHYSQIFILCAIDNFIEFLPSLFW